MFKEIFGSEQNLSPLLSDFKIWLNPKTLTTFHLHDFFTVSKNLLSTKVRPISSQDQRVLSKDLSFSEADMGNFALRVYFYQIFSSNKFSLDLRRSRFNFSDNWEFKGELMVGRFSKKFISSLRTTYDGYYSGDDVLLKRGLMNLGLMKVKWSENDKQEFLCLVKNHFGSDNNVISKFRMSEMIHSFTQIFEFIRDRKVKLSKDFIMLGVYLTSLYMALDSVDGEVDPHNSYKYGKLVAEEQG